VVTRSFMYFVRQGGDESPHGFAAFLCKRPLLYHK
jgi:hypothetical protein